MNGIDVYTDVFANFGIYVNGMGCWHVCVLNK